jgi:ubiquinone/menaquinone biosynthesis C-methylase UbiE
VYTTEIDCLSNGAPHAPEAKRYVEFFESLPQTSDYHFIRCYAAFDLYNKMRKMRERQFQISEFRECLRDGMQTAEKLAANLQVYSDFLTPERRRESKWGKREVEAETQNIYGSLFGDFSEAEYYEKAFSLLQERLEVNEIRIQDIGSKTALDAGCGGGRFSLALKRMGFRTVHGVDFSEPNIATAIKRRDARAVKGVEYRVANVLELPFDDGVFDFVFSNGVLHCTTKPIEEGLKEIHRVLRPGGELFVAVMEKPGGILFDTVELLRAVLKNVPLETAQRSFELMGLSGFRLYSLLDHLLVPINARTTPSELEQMIRRSGFRHCRRLMRGAATDQIELLHCTGATDPEAIWKYGVGENKYLCQK